MSLRKRSKTAKFPKKLARRNYLWKTGFAFIEILRFWCKNITEYETLIELISTSGGNIVVKYFDNKFHVFKNLSTLTPYYIYSDEIIFNTFTRTILTIPGVIYDYTTDLNNTTLTIPGIIYEYGLDETICVQIQQYNNLMNIDCEVIT